MPDYPPRAWIDWKVPKDEDGNEIGSASMGSISYDRYLNWLADYLFEADIPVPERQREEVEVYRQSGGASSAVYGLASSLGYSLFALYAIECEIEGGVTWEEFHRREVELLEQLSPMEREELEDEGVVLSREDFERICQEVAEREAGPSHIEHADIPFRPVFAALFKDVPDHEERYRLLKRFYSEFNECASK